MRLTTTNGSGSGLPVKQTIAKIGRKGREMSVVECVDAVSTAFPSRRQQQDIVDGTSSGAHGRCRMKRSGMLGRCQRHQSQPLADIDVDHLCGEGRSQADWDSTTRQGGKTFSQGMGRGISLPGR